MEQIEPVMAAFASTPELANTANSNPIRTLKVRFSVKLLRPKGGVVFRSTFSKGKICVTDEDVTLIKVTRKLFQPLLETEFVISRSQILDAKANGKLVHFEVHAPTGIHRVVMSASSHREARKILQWLPTQGSPAHEADRAALASYSERILALTPTTWVTYGLIAINVLVYLAMCAGGVGFMAQNAALTIKWGTNFGPETLSGGWWRLFTSMFIHFGLMHLLLNMFTLYQIGRLAERLYGSGRFLVLYLFAGLIGSIVSVVWHPTFNSAGASGAIFGVFGGLLVFLVKFRKQLPTTIAVQQRTSIAVLIGYNLFYGFTHPGIDNGAHLGGLVGGVLLGLTLAIPLSEPARAKEAFRSTVLSCVLALVVFGASAYVLARASEGIREELRFKNLVLTLDPAEKKAMSDMLALMHLPANTQSDRDAIANRVMQEVVPQWEKLYASLDNAHLAINSPNTALRATLLRYFDDRRKMYRLAAILAQRGPEPDATVLAQITALKSDTIEQAAAMKRMATANVSERR